MSNDEFPKRLYVSMRQGERSRTLDIALTEEDALKRVDESTVQVAVYEIAELWNPTEIKRREN